MRRLGEELILVRQRRQLPALRAASAGFSGGTGPRAKYTSSFGNPSKADSGRPKFFARSALGVWPIQSVMLKVPNSEK